MKIVCTNAYENKWSMHRTNYDHFWNTLPHIYFYKKGFLMISSFKLAWINSIALETHKNVQKFIPIYHTLYPHSFKCVELWLVRVDSDWWALDIRFKEDSAYKFSSTLKYYSHRLILLIWIFLLKIVPV